MLLFSFFEMFGYVFDFVLGFFILQVVFFGYFIGYVGNVVGLQMEVEDLDQFFFYFDVGLLKVIKMFDKVVCMGFFNRVVVKYG